MIPASVPRSVANAILRFAVWIAPHDTLDWGRGMLSELNHVEGNWSALIWSIGGAGVLAKHAILAIILPGSHRRTVSTPSKLFEKEGPMRKPALAVIASCVVASLLFFIAPVFRQAFQVSLAQWHDVFHVQRALGYLRADPELNKLAKQAEQDHDPELLAFVAMREPNQSESVRLADEAVGLDPNLTWLYATVAVHWSSFPEVDRWVPALQKFDPQNALPYLITAEKIDVDQVLRESVPHRVEDEPAAWKDAMAGAFRSSKLDDYLDRRKELNRSVLLHYRVDDPFQALADECWYRLPSYGVSDSSKYARLLVDSGNSLEGRGDHKGAAEKYLAVARFGQLMEPTDRFFLSGEIKDAYRQLGTLAERNGNNTDAAFYGSLSALLDRAAEKQLASWRSLSRGSTISRWNALLVRLSGLALLFCSALLFVCAVGLMARGRSIRLSSIRPSLITLAVGIGSAIGLLLASVVLLASYLPYSELLQSFISTGDESGIPELSNFLGNVQVPLGTVGFLGVSNVVFYFWFAITILCVLALLIAVVRHMQTRARTTAPA
jgi:hypothetical protein